jgi:hypothetical protein
MTKYQLHDFVKELKDLLTKHKVDIGVDLDGDTHGLCTSFVVDDEHGNSHILNDFARYVDAKDLEDYLKDHPIID